VIELVATVGRKIAAVNENYIMMRDYCSICGGDGMFAPWLNIVWLALESSEVIGLRVAKLAAGDLDAQHESRLIVSEKVDAVFEVGISLLSGATATNVVNRFRKQVAANAKRLSAGARAARSH
jgi:hypothetical protein